MWSNAFEAEAIMPQLKAWYKHRHILGKRYRSDKTELSELKDATLRGVAD